MKKSVAAVYFLCFILTISISSKLAQLDEEENNAGGISDDEPHCIWYGYVSGTHKPMYYNGTAVPVNELQYELMKQFCHELLEDGLDSKVCCDVNQVMLINVELMAYQGLFNRCPSCFENWRQFYCNYNCGPNQSEFIIVKNTTTIDVSSDDIEEEFYE